MRYVMREYANLASGLGSWYHIGRRRRAEALGTSLTFAEVLFAKKAQ